MGALRLYLDFINMFMFLLNLMGNRGAKRRVQTLPRGTKARWQHAGFFLIRQQGL